MSALMAIRFLLRITRGQSPCGLCPVITVYIPLLFNCLITLLFIIAPLPSFKLSEYTTDGLLIFFEVACGSCFACGA